MNVVARCKIYPLDQFIRTHQYRCNINGRSVARIHIVQDTLSSNEKTKDVLETVRVECVGNGLILNVSSMPWQISDSPVFIQANSSMLEFDTFTHFLSQLISDPKIALSRCKSYGGDLSKPLTWILLDNLSHLSLDPKYDSLALNKLLNALQRIFGAVVITTSLPLAFHGGVELSFEHSGKCPGGDQLLLIFNSSDVVL